MYTAFNFLALTLKAIRYRVKIVNTPHYPICNSLFTARRSFAPLQKSRRKEITVFYLRT